MYLIHASHKTLILVLVLALTVFIQGCNSSTSDGGGANEETSDGANVPQEPSDNADANDNDDGESGDVGSSPDSAARWHILFLARVSGYGNEFWTGTGDPDDGYTAIDLNPGSSSGVIGTTRAANAPIELRDSEVLFGGELADSGVELFVTNGTLDGTRMVKNIVPGGSSNPDGFAQLEEGLVLFNARNSDASNARSGLWATDGTEAGTYRVSGDVDPIDITPLGDGRAVFKGEVKIDPSSDTSPYKTVLMVTDGTSEGTRVIDDSLPTQPQGLHSLGDGRAVLYFFEESSFGSEPWITDGTSDGTVMIKNIASGDENGLSSPGFTKIADNTVVFSSGNRFDGYTLWVTDTTEEGTVKIADANPSNITPMGNGKAIFSARSSGIGNEPWVTDGTTEGTALLKDLRSGGDGNPTRFTVASEDIIYFVARDNLHGYELWVTDGTTAGTRMVKDIHPGEDSDRPIPHIVLNDGRLLFSADDGTGAGERFWVTDGTEQGTEPLASSQGIEFQIPALNAFFPVYIDTE